MHSSIFRAPAAEENVRDAIGGSIWNRWRPTSQPSISTPYRRLTIQTRTSLRAICAPPRPSTRSGSLARSVLGGGGGGRGGGGGFAHVFGVAAPENTKFGALTTAFVRAGAFVYVPAGTLASEPITIEYDLPEGASSFPYTVVLAEAGSDITIIERYRGAPRFVSGVAEIVTGENARVAFASHQTLGGATLCFQTRLSLPGKDATIDWMAADIGAALSVNELAVAIEQTGITAGVTAVFFPNGTQHVDVLSRIEHSVGNSVSNTIVKSAAIDSGQARYVGNIMIAQRAQGSNAALRDDALLLSKQAHIDSVPALEIAANDVKAYHGATVGALDPDQIFYMQSRGIIASAAERMIAIAFFEPAIERFPTRSLRDEIRAAIEGKLTTP
jgi:Fe-S cluster assembly protein SufD